MKSAYELAVERAGVKPVQKITRELKNKIEEIESIYRAKKAEADLSMQNRLRKVAGNIAEMNQIRENFAVELASINSKMEREKAKVRES
jgi:hypothetical protein